MASSGSETLRTQRRWPVPLLLNSTAAPRSLWYQPHLVGDCFIKSVYKRACPRLSGSGAEAGTRVALLRPAGSGPGQLGRWVNIRLPSLNQAGLKPAPLSFLFARWLCHSKSSWKPSYLFSCHTTLLPSSYQLLIFFFFLIC